MATEPRVSHTEPEALISNRIIRSPTREELAQWLHDWNSRDKDDMSVEDATQLCADYLYGRWTGLHGR